MNDLVNLVLPCLAPMVSDILGQLRALVRLKVVYFVLPHRCAIHGSKPPLTAAAALRSAWKPPRARKGRQGWRPGGVADMASYGRKKIAIVGIGNPQIDRTVFPGCSRWSFTNFQAGSLSIYFGVSIVQYEPSWCMISLGRFGLCLRAQSLNLEFKIVDVDSDVACCAWSSMTEYQYSGA